MAGELAAACRSLGPRRTWPPPGKGELDVSAATHDSGKAMALKGRAHGSCLRVLCRSRLVSSDVCRCVLHTRALQNIRVS